MVTVSGRCVEGYERRVGGYERFVGGYACLVGGHEARGGGDAGLVGGCEGRVGGCASRGEGCGGSVVGFSDAATSNGAILGSCGEVAPGSRRCPRCGQRSTDGASLRVRKNDPALAAAARELRDPFLEQLNEGQIARDGPAKYEVGRRLECAPSAMKVESMAHVPGRLALPLLEAA